MKDIIVLVTSGKGDEAETVRVVLFNTVIEAEEYCNIVSDEDPRKYWKYAEIIEAEHNYYPCRYNNYDEG